MNGYKKPKCTGTNSIQAISTNVIPALAGAVGVVAGKALAAAAVGAAATAGAKMFGDSKSRLSLTPMRRLEAIKQGV